MFNSFTTITVAHKSLYKQILLKPTMTEYETWNNKSDVSRLAQKTRNNISFSEFGSPAC